MRTTLLRGSLLAAALAFFPLASAQADPVFNPDNGHYYEIVFAPADAPFNGRISWTSARDAAAAMTHKNVAGHLATITDPDEDAFIRSLPGFDAAFTPFLFGAQFGDVGPWLGGTLNGTNWEWIDGSGEFSDGAGNALPGFYEDWLPHEPNGGLSEPRLGYFRSRVGNLQDLVGWADYPEFSFNVPAYVVEYPIPEPGALALLGLGLVGVYVRRKRRA